MAIIDPIHMPVLRKVFPELNPTKIEIFTLFAFGMSSKDVAMFRGTTPQAVSKVLRDLCDQYNVVSIDALKAVFAVRLGLYTQINFYEKIISG